MSSLFPFITNDLVPEETARSITQPFWGDLAGVWTSALERWQGMGEDDRARLGETSFIPGVILFGFAKSFAQERFTGREEEGLVPCNAIPNVFAVYVQESLLLRFNAFGRDFVVRNTENGSDLKDAYFRQESVPGIDNSATRLTVGYTLNAAKTEFDRLAISCQVGETCAYWFPIDDSEESVQPMPSPMTPPEPIAPSDELRRTRPR